MHLRDEGRKMDLTLSQIDAKLLEEIYHHIKVHSNKFHKFLQEKCRKGVHK